MCRTVKFEEMRDYHFYHMEAKASIVSRLSYEQGVVLRTCKLMDLSGLSRHHLDRRGLTFLRRIIELSQANYPEMLGSLYIVNVPWIFAVGWKIISAWFNPATLSKIHILTNDEYADVLNKAIPDGWIPGQ